MTTKFHITRAGRTEPCTAAVRACPLGEGNHFGSLAEAVSASVAAEPADPKSTFHAKTAPYDLRPYFATSTDQYGRANGMYFSPRMAYRGLLYPELGRDFASAIEDYPRGEGIRDGLSKLASPDFENDQAWKDSNERRLLAEEVPGLLSRLEDQAETATVERLFFEHGAEEPPAGTGQQTSDLDALVDQYQAEMTFEDEYVSQEPGGRVQREVTMRSAEGKDMGKLRILWGGDAYFNVDLPPRVQFGIHRKLEFHVTSKQEPSKAQPLGFEIWRGQGLRFLDDGELLAAHDEDFARFLGGIKAAEAEIDNHRDFERLHALGDLQIKQIPKKDEART